MKHQTSIPKILLEEARRVGCTPPEGDLDRLAEALEWLGPAAFRLGLTNYATTAEFTANLAAPVLSLLQASAAPLLQSPALDFGAGSGAVGITVAILRPDLQVILADRRARVVQFIDLGLRRLRLANCTALEADLANPPDDFREAVGTVLIRAFGPTAVALTHASRLVCPGGSIALWHQPPAPPPPADLRLADTLRTGVPSLALSLYERDIEAP
ncbi:MAG: RsmG family class I SAM-dependent methyltransferase [Armatimonadota bacterium]